jgi:hypothetical protein
MANACQTVEVVLIVYVCQVLVDQDVNQVHHALLIHVKMVGYVFLLDLVIDVIVHRVLQAITVKQKTYALVTPVKMAVNVDHKVQLSHVNVLMVFQVKDANHKIHVNQTRKYQVFFSNLIYNYEL